MSLFDELVGKSTKISLIGLGYVGMPLAVELSKMFQVIGYDINEDKINQYKQGLDPTCEVGNERIQQSKVEFTSDAARLAEAKFHIVAVPTPINQDKTPDLLPVEDASRTLGKYLTRGSIVVFESTVYPGVTEDICVPILEMESGLEYGLDFKVGYSPERINPGDKIHTLTNITKIISGSDKEALSEIKKVYDSIIQAGTFQVSSIKTAEAIKVVENSQRDINIAFMNELALVFDRMKIDTNEVIDGMNTKWNALGFRPGLVGGHCIGIDPYYFTYEAERLGYHSQIVLAGRRINDSMGNYIADASIKELVKAGKAPAKSKVVILGLTFKENCPDCRNSKVGDVIERLREYGIDPIVVDPWANKTEAELWYRVCLYDIGEISDADCVIVAVAHSCFSELTVQDYADLYSHYDYSQCVLIDVKGIVDVAIARELGLHFWRL